MPGDELLEDATTSNWESEHIGDLAASQLKELGKAISGFTEIDEPVISNIVGADFRCGLLRPLDLQVVFQDRPFTVFRPSRATVGSEDMQTELTGARRLARAIRQLLEPFAGASHVRFEQKVVRVNLGEAHVRTRSLVHLYGEPPGSGVQQNMVWDCRWERSSGDKLQLSTIRVADYEELRAERPGGDPALADCTEAALGASPTYRDVLAHGQDYWVDRIEARFGIDPTAWHGLAIGDVNGDGLDDVYLCQPGGLPNALFVQSADGTATDVAAEAGVALRDQTHSALLVDLDSDGDQDLVLGTLVGVLIFANDGQGRFVRRTVKLTPDGMPFGLSAADYDEDGDLDLYVCCYSKRARTAVSRQFVGRVGRPVPYHDANNGARNLLLRNNRRWQFPDVTQRVGLGQNNQRFSFAAAWEDYDNDGDQDLYVANDYGRNNLYRNEGGTFVDVAASAGVEDISAGMSVSWGDVDNDGWMDLYVSNMFSSAGNRVGYQRQFQVAADEATRAEFQRHARGNSLFLNAGDGTFRDVSEPAAVTMGRWAWGSTFTDLNKDGWKDIVVANGFLTQELPDDL
jgi:hypothetical protein